MSVRLFVLGLVRERPQHGYELHRWLERSQTMVWADVLPGSIYHALRQMHKEGLIEVRATEHSGNRARAIYSITAAGEHAFDRLLAEGWQQRLSSFPVALYTLLTFSQHLSTVRLRDAIEQQLVKLTDELEHWAQGAAAKEEAEVLPPWGQAMFNNGREHLEADLRLLRSVLALLPKDDS
jgi:DNA-binding PadR family transcriptional regulator